MRRCVGDGGKAGGEPEALAEGVQPPIMLDEFVECEEAVRSRREFLAA